MALRSVSSFFLLASAAAAFAVPATFQTKPDVHGDLVVFTCEGDLWLGSLSSNQARRLTSDIGVETNARFSPDGSQIAYTAQYEGRNDVYVIRVDGGAPKRLTFDPTGAQVQGWTTDGKAVLFRSFRDLPFEYQHLFTVPVTGGLASRVPVPSGFFGSFGPDGLLAYVPHSREWANWFRYKAGNADAIWLYNSQTRKFSQLTNELTVETTPVWSGKDLFFISERTGVSNLYVMDPKTKSVKAITQSADAVRYPGADAERVVFQDGAGLGLYDRSTGKVRKLDFQLASDHVHEVTQRIPLTAVNATAGPNGKRIAVEARGQILSLPVAKGDARLLENSAGHRAILPAWSPDGTQLAFFSDRSGEYELWITDATGSGEPKQLTKGFAGNPVAPTWSPDGKFLVVTNRANDYIKIDAVSGAIKVIYKGTFVGSYNNSGTAAISPDGRLIAYVAFTSVSTQIEIYDVKTDKTFTASDPIYRAFSPSFDPSGKFLVYLATRNFNVSVDDLSQMMYFDKANRVSLVTLHASTPSPFLPKVAEEVSAKPDPKAPAEEPELTGLQSRTIEVPVPAGRYTQVEALEGKLFLVSGDDVSNLNVPSPTSIDSFDIDKKVLTRIAGGAAIVSKVPNGKRVLISINDGFQVVEAESGPVTPNPVKTRSFTVTVDPKFEWSQIFEESWRIARDFFYDPGMHGVDWKAVHAKYIEQMKLVGDRSDLTQLLKDMVAELNTGHCYVSNPEPSRARANMGFLGAEYEAVPGSDAVRIKSLLRGDVFNPGLRSPLLEPGVNVKEGDYILAIAGQPVRRDVDIQGLLQGLAGQTVAITVNSQPTFAGSRKVFVEPLSSETELRYQAYVESRKEYVRKNAGPNFGYSQLIDMTGAGAAGFAKGHYLNIEKDATIYDFRFNGGGFISSLVLNSIATKPVVWWKPREGGYWAREAWGGQGYAAALCNEEGFSDGELVIETWKAMKLGPVVGKRTGGGEVGSGSGYDMIDGGKLYIPNYAAFLGDRWVIEGVGATPDYEVDQDPEAVMAGRDPQLDKAIELLKAKLAKNPIVRPIHPPFPNKALKPRKG